MQYSKVLNISFYSNIVNFILKNRLLIIFTLIFIFGFSLSVFQGDKYEFIKNCTESYFKNFISVRNNSTFLNVVSNSYFSAMFYIVLCVLSGGSIFGVLLVPLVVCFKGFIFGCFSAYLYSVYSFEGVAFHAVVILPSAIIFTITLIYCSIESVVLSLNLAKLTFKENISNSVFFNFKRFTYKLLIYNIFILLAAVLEALLTKGLIKNFSGII